MEVIKSHAGTKQYIPEASNRGVGGNTTAAQNPGTSRHQSVPPTSTPRVSSLSQQQLDDVLQTRAAIVFLEQNPDYYPSPANSQRLQDYVREHNLPRHLTSSWQSSFDALTLSGELEQRPEPTTPVEPEAEFQPRKTERHTSGVVRSFHNPREIDALKTIPLKELKKIVDAETSSTRASLTRRGVKL